MGRRPGSNEAWLPDPLAQLRFRTHSTGEVDSTAIESQWPGQMGYTVLHVLAWELVVILGLLCCAFVYWSCARGLSLPQIVTTILCSRCSGATSREWRSAK